ncbi:MAG TPA: aspartate aminotransferase family protein [Anaerolineales bacterium]|nr:aspartate aminotransferase family protein [Anaerolineales bacterium]HNN14143.1 aspartate aminotransferase family protein [Anaerolineales bacterium]HNO31539.1 aspartate aminotransferase family protein [Anaerolineales bacterium]
MTNQTQNWIEKDRKQLHPVYHPKTHANPMVIEKGEGVWLHLTDGRKILDAMAGLWNVNVGYGREELAKVAYDQMKDLAFTSNFSGMTNLPSIQLAEKMAGFAYEGLNSTLFTSGGSEANDSAFKTARYYWKRKGKSTKYKVIARKGAYHGVTIGTTFATGLEKYHSMFGPAPEGYVHIPAPNPYRYDGKLKDGETVGQAAARELEEAILREGADTVAAFIAEPVMGVGGVIVPPADYFPLVRQICDKYEVLLIADEVITGFGRTGEWFALKHWNVKPDILSFAKAITSGYAQLGGIQISDEIRDTMESAADTEAYMHGYTYSGHAMSCAVGLKNIEIMERENYPQRARELGKRLLDGLKSLSEFPFVGDVRGLGLVCGVEIVSDKAAKTADPAMTMRVFKAAEERGLRSRPLGNTLAFSPPLSINEEEVDEIVKRLGAAMDGIG